MDSYNSIILILCYNLSIIIKINLFILFNLFNYLSNLRPGVLINTLSYIWGELNLPTLLFKVGLLTLINMDSFI